MTFDAYVTAIRTVIDEIAVTPQPAPMQKADDEEATATWQGPGGHSAAVVAKLDPQGALRDVRVYFDTFASDETWTTDEHGAEALGVRIALRLQIEARS